MTIHFKITNEKRHEGLTQIRAQGFKNFKAVNCMVAAFAGAVHDMAIIQSVRKFYAETEFFHPEHTLSCGQVFRFERDGGGWFVMSGSDIAYILKSKEDAGYDIYCSDESYFRKYFDLSTDYGAIIQGVSVNDFMRDAINFGRGIRILRQPHFETLISFIISANNNILRIQGILKRMCEALGEKCEFVGKIYHAFPTPQAIASRGAEFFRELGAGYRADSIVQAARKVADGFDLDAVQNLCMTDARAALMSFKGVGPKVCDCILLFSYGRSEAFPVDTWMEKVYNQHFAKEGGAPKTRTEIARYFYSMFGDLSGYAQQYLFYYKRSGRV